MQFRAHGQAAPGDTTAFSVGAGVQNLFQCFYFKAPWNTPVHGVRFRGLYDLTAVVKRWMLYSSTTAKPDGSMESCSGVHPSAELIAGGAPGGNDWVLPADVGIALPQGANGYFTLELQYANPSAGAALDRSGVEVCATTELKSHSATVSWVGTPNIFIPAQSQSSASGICTPNYSRGPITIIQTWPHMHALGRRFRTDITRAGGLIETLINVPSFHVDQEYSYPTNPPVVLNQGDGLRTTCEYANVTGQSVTFGPNPEHEMCYNFVLAYPARALVSSGLMADSCEL